MHPEEYYKQQLAQKAEQLNATQKSVSTFSWLRIFLAIVLLGVLYLAFAYGETWQWLLAGTGIVAFFYLMGVHAAHKEKERRLHIHIDILNAELKALNDDYSSFLPGNEFVNVAHPYSFDLDIFGRGSIFQMLCRTVTKDGEQRLARLLERPYATAIEIKERQQSLQELGSMPGFMESFRVSGIRYTEEAKDMSKVLGWLRDDDKFISKKYLFVLAALIPILTIIFGVLSVQQGDFHQGLLFVLIANWAVLLIHSKDIKQTHLLVGRSIKFIDKYEQLLAVTASATFKTATLSHIQQQATASVRQITEFRKLAHLFDSRQNGMVGPLMNSFFLFDIYCVLRLESWRTKSKNQLDEAFSNISLLDSYISLATYAFNNPENIYPVINEQSTAIEATDVKHPLLNTRSAIGNDMSLGKQEQLYLLTGANMTGKSTFIRTVGINLILAYLGVPVRARSFGLPLLRMYTAIRISDSVQDDISYFKAELNRMQQLMQTVQQSDVPYLILLDEPLRGTNSTDKQMGTQSIMEKLLQYKAIGIVATHDTGLCKLEQAYPSKISNYHFESEVTDTGLKFDFKLKTGGSTSNNATILMKLMGIVS
ncbi:MAG: hypothetical protein EOP56_11855 [Sphingobacteriales bacterium]|nr:MAG: hypothetical protein EOP56_11855 [Sphingobacteriales bacterium]